MQFFKGFLVSRINKIIFSLGIILIFISFLDLPNRINNIILLSYLILALFLFSFSIEKNRKALDDSFAILQKSIGKEVSNELLPQIEQVLISAETAYTSEAEQAYNYFATRYGVGYDLLEIECFINEDGSATVKRKVTLVSFSEIDKLDTYLLIPEKSPGGEPRDIALGNIKSLTSKTSITRGAIREEFGRLSVEITISPALSSGISAAYEMTERLPPNLFAVRATRDEIIKRETPYDYFGWNVNRPTRKLSLRVYFPGFPYPIKPDIYGAEVRYASASGFPANRIQHEEQKNLQGPILAEPEGDRHYLNLEVEYPMIGLVYVLRWQPIEKNDRVNIGEVSSISDLSRNYLTYIRNILIERFDEGEIRTLIMDLGIDYEVIPGKDKSELARELVTYLERRNQIQNLVQIARVQRPDISWPNKGE